MGKQATPTQTHLLLEVTFILEVTFMAVGEPDYQFVDPNTTHSYRKENLNDSTEMIHLSDKCHSSLLYIYVQHYQINAKLGPI